MITATPTNKITLHNGVICTHCGAVMGVELVATTAEDDIILTVFCIDCGNDTTRRIVAIELGRLVNRVDLM